MQEKHIKVDVGSADLSSDQLPITLGTLEFNVLAPGNTQECGMLCFLLEVFSR